MGISELIFRNRTKCTHKFSSFHIHDYIVKYVHANPDTDAPPAGFAPCPIAGCSVLLSKEDLAPDDFFAKRVADHLKKEKEDKANGRGRKDGTQYMTVVESDEDDE